VRRAVTLIGALIEHGALGAAVVDPEAAVLQSRLDDRVEVLRDLARSFSPVARQMNPPARRLELGFGDRRLVLLPSGQRMVAFTVGTDTSIDALLAEAEPALAALAGGTLAAPSPQPAPTVAVPATPQAQLAALLAAVNRVAEHAGRTLGGPVVRNYLKKSRETAEDPRLDEIRLDLSGRASLPDDHGIEDPGDLGASVRLWVDAFVQRASAVDRDIADLDVEVACHDLQPALTGTGFLKENR